MIQRKNANDVRCGLWVLRNITDPEALDTAIRLAGRIQWFEDGLDAEPPYNLIVSTFHTCFGSSREVYPGSRYRAYYSLQAISWINTLAMCKSEEFARKFPLPTARYTAPDSDLDLESLLRFCARYSVRFVCLFLLDEGHTSSHVRWTSNVLLHLSWVTRAPLGSGPGYSWGGSIGQGGIPPDATLNHLRMCCNFLGSTVEEEVLKVHEKS